MQRPMRIRFFWMSVTALAVWIAAAGYASAATEIQSWGELVQALESAPAEERTARLALQFLDRFPGSAWQAAARYAAGEVFFPRREYTQAQNNFQAARDTGAPNIADSAAFRLGECAWNTGALDQAKKEWDDLLTRFPDSPLQAEAELALCRLLLRQDRSKEAANRYFDFLANNTGYRADPRVQTDLARIELGRGQALAAWQQLAALNSPEAIYLKCRALLSLQRADEAVELIAVHAEDTAVQAVLPQKAALVWDLFAGAFDTQALTAAQSLLKAHLPPAIAADLKVLQVVCLLNLDRFEPAAAAAAAAAPAGQDPQITAYLQFLRGLAFYRFQRRAQALQVWKEALGGADANDSGQLPLLVADQLLAGGDFESARESCQVWLQHHANHPARGPVYQRLAQAFYRLGRDQEAVAAYRDYLRSTSGHPETPTPVAGPSASARLRPDNQPALAGVQARMAALAAPGAKMEYPLASRLTASPWLQIITKPPVLRIRIPNPSEAPAPAQAWEFQVSDPAGRRSFYHLAGQGQLPESLVWDGMLADGRRLQVGEPFRYTVTLKDQTGKTLSASAQNGQLSALVYPREDGTCVSLLAAAIFEKAGSALLPMGRSFLKAACDELFRHPGVSLHVAVVTQDTRLGRARAEAVRHYIAERWDWPVDSFDIRLITTAYAEADRVDLVRGK
jgi:tetratricopeptide (TPR) repeat protein